MVLYVNGEKREFDKKDITLDELLKFCEVENSSMVAVQVNGEFVERGDYGKMVLKNNDVVDFLYFMGGGEK
ncbi:MAG: sulfur carrier protein ThiS [Chitinispirillaceae bacterium]|nr:sulfur carrier protein ThiS [Chitinispirillaceae bacterium]